VGYANYFGVKRVMSAVYWNGDIRTAAVFRLSSKAASLVLPLWFNIDDDNLVDRLKFQKRLARIKDYRSWKKYWKELEENQVIVFLDRKTIMVSPHECYKAGVSQRTLITKWDALCN